jgi:hypothetical protein
MSAAIVDGRPVYNVKIGCNGASYNSVSFFNGLLNLNDPVWYLLSFIGTQSLYQNVDVVPADINDGSWHRITWDLKNFVNDKINSSNLKISQIILGSWKNPSEPISVDFRGFSIWKCNMLN